MFVQKIRSYNVDEIDTWKEEEQRRVKTEKKNS